jgi:hypothetical protein
MTPLWAEFLAFILFTFWVCGIPVGVAVWIEYSKRLGASILIITALSYLIFAHSIIVKM